jgi:ComF family protein
MWRALMDGLLSLLYPPRCAVCETLQEPVLCPACRGEFRHFSPPWCARCGLPFDPRARAMPECAACREHPPPFATARAAGRYAGTLRQAIHCLKYDGVRALAGPLVDFVCQSVPRPDGLSLLTPVPLHRSRERMRGFNQSRLLADALAEQWEIPVSAGLLQRVRATPPQMQLAAEERRKNLRGAFAVAGNAAGLTVGLIDDVYTTGSTLRECAQTLRRAGARTVHVITVARVVEE